jgi:hypothetical protein
LQLVVHACSQLPPGTRQNKKMWGLPPHFHSRHR